VAKLTLCDAYFAKPTRADATLQTLQQVNTTPLLQCLALSTSSTWVVQNWMVSMNGPNETEIAAHCIPNIAAVAAIYRTLQVLLDITDARCRRR
jgi:hypothetical protein